MKHVALLVVLVACLALAGAALAVESAGPAIPAKKPAPSFKPGAEVTMALTFNAPEDYAFNEAIPLTVKFDAEMLKKASFTVEKDTWEFELKPHVGRTTVSIPIKLKDNVAEGALVVPLEASCIVCTLDGEGCMPLSEGLSVHLTVRKSAGKDEENQAQAKGSQPWQHTFSAM